MKPLKSSIKILTYCFLLYIMLLNCCDQSSREMITDTKEHVKIFTAELTEITPEVRSFGTISYFRKTDISVTTSGIIKWIGVQEGDLVTSNQVLAEIDNIQLRIQKRRTESQIQQAQSTLELYQAKLWQARLDIEARLISVDIGELEITQKKIELDDLERTLNNKEQLYAVGGISEEAIHSLRMNFQAEKTSYELACKSLEMRQIGLRDKDILSLGLPLPQTEEERLKVFTEINTQTLAAEVKVARASLDAARTELEAVNQLLAETIIRSPLRGIIGMKYLEQGERIQAETKLFTILDISRVFAVFPIQEQDAFYITEGMDAEISVDALNQKIFNASIYLIAPLVDPQTGNVTVKAVMDNPNLILKPGMFVRVRVITGPPRQAILIPKTCISRRDGNNAEIFTISRGRVFINKVVLGVEKEDLIEVSRGLNQGETVIDSPSPILKEGQEVAIEE